MEIVNWRRQQVGAGPTDGGLAARVITPAVVVALRSCRLVCVFFFQSLKLMLPGVDMLNHGGADKNCGLGMTTPVWDNDPDGGIIEVCEPSKPLGFVASGCGPVARCPPFLAPVSCPGLRRRCETKRRAPSTLRCSNRMRRPHLVQTF